MASIRRTLSPAYHDRTYQNGAASAAANSPLSISSPSSQKNFSNNSTNSYSALAFRKLIASTFLQRRHRFRRSLYHCFIFFLIGLFIGFFTNSHVDNATDNVNVNVNDFSFEIKPPHVNVQLDDGDNRSIKRDELGVSLNFVNANQNSVSPMKQLIVITPTYNRAMQGYFLNRFGQLLKLVHPPLLWIVVEMKTASFETADVLRKTGVMYRHLVCDKNLTNVKDRGVYQRNTALEHIERHKLDGIVYFADDDNVYSIQLFESLREISRFGTWPVAMLAQSKNKAILEGPVCNGTQVIGWHTNEKSKRLRRFHVDMSGFAFNSTILWDPKRWQRPYSNPIRQLDTVKEGFQETTFIEQVVEDESQMEGISPGCSRVLNWHLHLDAHGLVYPRGWLFQKNLDVNLPI